jgi:branched-chain amino acid transport system substrate-binding protein
MNRKTFLGGAAAAVGATPTQPFLTSPFTPTLRIAAVCPQSGEDRAIGMELLRGIRAAVGYLNDQRASFNDFLILDAYDDGNRASDATVKSSFACGNPATLAVIGHLSAAATLVAEPVYAQATMPLIVPTVTDDRITARSYQNVFRLPIRDGDEGSLVASYVIATGSKAPYVVTQDGDYGPAVAAGFVRRAGALHINANSSTFSLDKPDYVAAAAAIVARFPDCVVLAGNAEDMGPLLGALRSTGYTGRFVGTQGFFDPITVQLYAKVADGMVVSSAVPYYPLAPTTALNVRDYQAHNGALSPVAAYGYAAIQLIQLAQQRSGATNRLNMIRALSNGGSFDTVTGTYSFGPTGDVLDPNCYFYVLKDGKFAYERQAHRSGFMLK